MVAGIYMHSDSCTGGEEKADLREELNQQESG